MSEEPPIPQAPPPAPPTEPAQAAPPLLGPGVAPAPARPSASPTHHRRILLTCLVGAALLYVLTRAFAAHHLGLIKGVSLAIAGLCAVLNHWKKRHDIHGNLDGFGKNIALLMILGGFTTLAATFLEESNKVAAAKSAKLATDEQLTNIHHILLKVEAQQLQGQTQMFLLQQQQLQGQTQLALLQQQQLRGQAELAVLQQVLSGVQTQQLETVSVISNLDQQSQLAAKTIANVERLLSPLTPPELEFTCQVLVPEDLAPAIAAVSPVAPPQDPPGMPGSPRELALAQITKALGAWQSQHPGYALANAFPFLSAPDLATLSLRLYAPATHPRRWSAPDFYLLANPAGAPTASYLPAKRALELHWTYSAPTNFSRSAQLFSLPDLAGARMRVDIGERAHLPPDAFATPTFRFLPLDATAQLRLRFGTTCLLITNLALLPAAPTSTNNLTPDEIAQIHEPLPFIRALDDADSNPHPAIFAAATTLPTLDRMVAKFAAEIINSPQPPSGLRIIMLQ